MYKGVYVNKILATEIGVFLFQLHASSTVTVMEYAMDLDPSASMVDVCVDFGLNK